MIARSRRRSGRDLMSRDLRDLFAETGKEGIGDAKGIGTCS